MNETVTNNVTMTYYGQKAFPNRTNFTPGTVNGKANDMNWPREFAVPVAGWVGGTDWTFKRTFKTGRQSISDVKISETILEKETKVDNGEWINPDLGIQ